MQMQPRRDTQPELQIRRLLFASGLRYRVNLRVPGLARRSIDIAFPRRQVAVFVDGCFWHSCPVHGVAPANNAEWLAAKLAANKARDLETASHLDSLGWRVLRIWEHEKAEDAACRIVAALGKACV